MCREIAPGTFTRDDDEGMSYVWKQPVSPEEIAAAEEARGACPTETIGNGGSGANFGISRHPQECSSTLSRDEHKRRNEFRAPWDHISQSFFNGTAGCLEPPMGMTSRPS